MHFLEKRDIARDAKKNTCLISVVKDVGNDLYQNQSVVIQFQILKHMTVIKVFFFFLYRFFLLTVYMSTLTYWSFLFLYFCVRFLCGANRLCVGLSLLSHEIEQFGSLHMCAPKKHIGVDHATNELSWRHI